MQQRLLFSLLLIIGHTYGVTQVFRTDYYMRTDDGELVSNPKQELLHHVIQAASHEIKRSNVITVKDGDLVMIDARFLVPALNSTYGNSWTREYNSMPFGIPVIQELKNDNRFTVSNFSLSFKAEPTLGGIYRLTYHLNDADIYVLDGEEEQYVNSVTYTYFVTVNSREIKTRVEFYTDYSPIAVSNTYGRSGKQPMAICIVETSYTEGISFLTSSAYINYETRYPEQSVDRMNRKDYSYHDKSANAPYQYYSIISSSHGYVDIENYTAQSQYRSLYDHHEYSDNGFTYKHYGPNQVSIVWLQTSYRDEAYERSPKENLEYKCVAAAPGNLFSETSDYLMTNGYPKRDIVDISYELREHVSRKQPNTTKLIYEGDYLTLSCAVPSNQNWNVEWRRGSRNGPIVLALETVNKYQRKFTIEFKHLKMNDSGSYVCFDANEKTGPNGTYVRQAVASFNVLPTAKPLLSSNFTSLSYKRNFSLECPLIGSPKPTYQWYFNGVPYENAWQTWVLTGISEDGRTINFKMLRTWLQGNWTCRATNGLGEAKFKFGVFASEKLPEEKRLWQVTFVSVLLLAILLVVLIIVTIIRLIVKLLQFIVRGLKKLKNGSLDCLRKFNAYLDEGARLLPPGEEEEFEKSEENPISLPNSAITHQEEA